MYLNLTFEYSAGWILLCILAGIVYSLGLYFRDRAFAEFPPSFKPVKYFLAFLRFTGITLIALLLMAPYLKTKITSTQKPIIVIAQDNSGSLKFGLNEADSSAYVQKINEVIDKLSASYDVITFSFGESVREGLSFTFDDKETDISALLETISRIYANQNLGAVIIASDGIFNKGQNPYYLPTDILAPVYTIALGDTTPASDIIVERLYYNRLVYLDDRFQVKADITVNNLKPLRTPVRLYKIGSAGKAELLQEQQLTTEAGKTGYQAEFLLDANETGILHYRLVVNPVPGETTTENNVRDFFVEVLESRKKILFVAHAPHPDIAALRNAIESNKNYQTTLVYADDLKNVKPESFDLVIFHQLPSSSYPLQNFIKAVDEASLPVLYIIGNATAIPVFNGLQPVVRINGNLSTLNEAQGTLNPAFSLFTLNEIREEWIRRFPPMYVPFGEYETGTGTTTLLYQKIGAVKTDYPLIAFNNRQNRKYGVFAGEGFWRWRLADYQQHNDHRITDELISKTVQYLSVKADKRQFRVVLPKNIFLENEPIEFNAELYNEAYEPVNDPDVMLTITNEKGEEFPLEFYKTGNGYTLKTGPFPAGNYTFIARVRYNDKELTYEGKFSVTPIQLEALNTTANHRLLYQLSRKYGGELIYPQALDRLPELISNNENIKPTVYVSYKTQAVINLKWLVFIIAFLFSLEWFIRKFNGVY